MIDFRDLSDEELALIVYSLERELDDGGYGFMDHFREIGDDILRYAMAEYAARALHYSMFIEDEE